MNNLITSDMLKNQCYCGHKFAEHPWKSTFHKDMHYKSTNCPKCNRSVSLKVDFMGSGHDSWDGTKNWSLAEYEQAQKSKTIIRNLDNIVKRYRDTKND